MYRGNEFSLLSSRGTVDMTKIKAKYKIGDVVKIKPGTFIGWIGDDGVISDDSTCVVIKDINEFYGFVPDYYVKFLLDDPIEYVSCCYDESYIVGYANISFGDDDICAG